MIADEKPLEEIFQLSLRFLMGYSCGIGNIKTYALFLNSVTADLSVLFRLNFFSQHSLWFGLGAALAWDIFSYTPKYESALTGFQQDAGMSASLGYQFRLAEKLSFFAECIFCVFFGGKNLSSIKTHAGISIGL